MGRKVKNAQILYDHLFSNPMLNAGDIAEVVKLSPKAANDLINDFIKAGILKELTGFQRNRLFSYATYLNLFETK